MEQKENPSIYLETKESDNKSDPDLLSEFNLDAKFLYTTYPPKFKTRAKLLSYEKVKKEAEYNPSQVLRMTRWRTMSLPENYNSKTFVQFMHSDTVFQYEPRKEDEFFKQIDWHLNFAHSNLFVCYPGRLLAQDELQVLECPILASVREFLMTDQKAKTFAPYTVQKRQATPILIANADRVISLDTYPDGAKGRPNGLYGNNFEQASDKAVDLATNILKPPTRVNILAMEAPPGDYGKYTKEMITFILQSCYTGFVAAKKESATVSALLREERKWPGVIAENEIKTNIFTGFWGCGAYGGDRELMVILQLIGAQLAGVDSLTMHAVHKEGKQAVEKAFQRFSGIMKDAKEEIKVSELIERLEKAGFRWGVSNGT